MIKISDINTNSLPICSGIYTFLENGNILYIGQSSNLRNRIKSYINLQDTRKHVAYMMEISTDIEYSTTNSVEESIILESDLIKKIKPPLNIKLKYSSNLYFIHSNLNDKIPKIEIKSPPISFGENILNIGPISKSFTPRQAVDFISDILKLRICKDGKCMHCQISSCSGSYKKEENLKEYINNIRSFYSLLIRGDHAIENKIKSLHDKYCRNMYFENASIAHKSLKLIKSTNILHSYKLSASGNIVVLLTHYSNKNNEIWISITSFSGLCNTRSNRIAYSNSDDIESSIRHIIIEESQNIANNVRYILSEETFKQISKDFIDVMPLISDKVSISAPTSESDDTCIKIASIINSEEPQNTSKQFDFTRLTQDLNLLKTIYSIHCIDIAHISGKASTGSIVSLYENQDHPTIFTTIDISNKNAKNDVGAIKEVVYEYLSILISSKNPLPDLIMIDGGKNQLNAGIQALDKLNISSYNRPSIISISKESGDHSKKLTQDLIHTEIGETIKFPRVNKTLFDLQNIRDSAHYMANKYMLKKFWRSNKNGIINSIKGVGPVYRNKLLSSFKSISEIVSYSPDKISKITRIPIRISKKIHLVLSKILS
ncbi:MAG: GIY-YIG nuclease family protein [Chlamydiia bacterium]|nr:GIY-YIG nuclease family protein [Chlamydiia bacterium]